MSTFAVRVCRINEPVVSHPDADKLSLVQIAGYTCISAKKEDGSHRYSEGDWVVYVPEGAVVPEPVLKFFGYWDTEKDKGFLDGERGCRVKARKLRGVFSQGIILPVEGTGKLAMMFREGGNWANVALGDDMSEFLEITKYEPPIPTSMQGQVMARHKLPVHYDFDSIQTNPDLFTNGERVVVTEKLHGTFVQFGFVKDFSDPDLFDHQFFVTSKGIGAKGLVFKNVPENDGNLYVKALRSLADGGVLESIYEEFLLADSVRFFGEVFGAGVQDLHYGLKNARLRVFDVMVNERFLPAEQVAELTKELGLEYVPILYVGAYDEGILRTLRDGKDTLSQSHVREGIVIRSSHETMHPVHGRKIAKWVSPDYLTRKAKNATEFN